MSDKITIELTQAQLQHIATRLQSPLDSEGYGSDQEGTKESVCRSVSEWIEGRAKFVKEHHWNKDPKVDRASIVGLGEELDQDAAVLALIAAKLPSAG